jgi:hypothetical protein
MRRLENLKRRTELSSTSLLEGFHDYPEVRLRENSAEAAMSLSTTIAVMKITKTNKSRFIKAITGEGMHVGQASNPIINFRAVMLTQLVHLAHTGIPSPAAMVHFSALAFFRRGASLRWSP